MHDPLESRLRKCSDELEVCGRLIRLNGVEPVEENIKSLGTARGKIVDVLMHFETFRSSVSNPRKLGCTFCGKNKDEVERLIAGPGVHICKECVELCVGVLNEPE